MKLACYWEKLVDLADNRRYDYDDYINNRMSSVPVKDQKGLSAYRNLMMLETDKRKVEFVRYNLFEVNDYIARLKHVFYGQLACLANLDWLICLSGTFKLFVPMIEYEEKL